VCTLKKYPFPLNFKKAFAGKGLFIYKKLSVCYFRVGGKNLNCKDFYVNYFRVGNVLAINYVVLKPKEVGVAILPEEGGVHWVGEAPDSDGGRVLVSPAHFHKRSS
jgi:hypothetical protein